MEPGKKEVWLTLKSAQLFAWPLWGKYASSLGLRGDEHVLEVGCGVGALSRYLAGTLCAGGGRLVCVDVSDVWLSQAWRRLNRFGCVEFRRVDATAVPLGEAIYDRVIFHFVVHDLDRQGQRQLLLNAARALRPGGIMNLREPIEQGTGICVPELKAVLDQGGLVPRSEQRGSIVTQGSVYTAVYEKKQ